MNASESLVQIRTAYRLLNAYHRRLLDLLMVTRDAVKAQFGELPKAWWGTFQFWSLPRSNSDPTTGGRWPFDFIPLQDVYVNWASTEDPSKGGFYFGLGHAADDALDKEKFPGEPDPLTFPDVRSSKTTLHAWVVTAGPSSASSWQDLANKRLPTDKIPQSSWEDRSVHKLQEDGDVLHFGGFVVDVADVWTRDLLDVNLIKPLLALILETSEGLPNAKGRNKARRR